MATTLADLRLRLAYRLNENNASANGSASELARRDSFINEGYRKVMSEHYWWFAATIGATHTTDGQEIYSLPSGFRDMIELRQNRRVMSVIAESDALGTYNYPPNFQYDSLKPRYFIYGDSELHLLPIPGETPDTLTVSSITQTGGTATLTAAAAHGLQANDWITVAGADQAGYNLTAKVLTVPSTTTLTYEVAAATVSPATGTITYQWQNLTYRYHAYYTPMTASTSTTLIPDQFTDILVAFAYGRYGFVDDSKGNSEAGFAEYNQLLLDLKREQNRREFWGKATAPETAEVYD